MAVRITKCSLAPWRQIQKPPGIVERGWFDPLGVALTYCFLLGNATPRAWNPHLSQLTVPERPQSEGTRQSLSPGKFSAAATSQSWAAGLHEYSQSAAGQDR